jgi:hypothetical protein
MTASLIILITMTVLVAALAVYRSIVARREDDLLRIVDQSGQLVNNQRVIASTLKRVDRYGVVLTVLTAVYGVALLATFVYKGLLEHGSM